MQHVYGQLPPMYYARNSCFGPEVPMRSHHNLGSLTSELLAAAKLLPPEDFWRLAAVVTRTWRETHARQRKPEDELSGVKSGH